MSSKYPNMKCMHINIYVHNMQIDEMFDFITGRIDMPPAYWTSHEDIPHSISGGYLQVSVSYDTYCKIREIREGGNPFTK